MRAQRKLGKWRLSSRKGFTLLEMFVVVALIGVLLVVLLPAVARTRETARRLQCRNNMMQLGLALQNYHGAHRVLPSGCVNPTGPILEGQIGYRIGWIVQILPFVDQAGVYRTIDFVRPELSFLSEHDRKRYFAELLRLTASPGSSSSTDNSESRESLQLFELRMPSDDSPAGTDGFGGSSPPAPFTGLVRSREEADAPQLPNPQSFSSDGLRSIHFLSCPSSGIGGGTTNFNGVSHYAGCHSSQETAIDTDNDGLLYLNSSESLAAVPDGISNTILLGEHLSDPRGDGWFFGDRSTLRNGGSALRRYDERQKPIDYKEQFDLRTADESSLSEEDRVKRDRQFRFVGGFQSGHSDINFVLADGSLKAINPLIRPEVFRRLCSRNDGALVSSDEF